jgi:glutathione S-transferase
MKIHFSNTEYGRNRLAKVKAVAILTKTDLVEVPFDEKSAVAKSVHYQTLPILETSQGSLFSTNAILRFLANSSNSLYGANAHEQVVPKYNLGTC